MSSLTIMIEHWRKREEHWLAIGLPHMAATARRYREALERLQALERS